MEILIQKQIDSNRVCVFIYVLIRNSDGEKNKGDGIFVNWLSNNPSTHNMLLWKMSHLIDDNHSDMAVKTHFFLVNYFFV